MEKEEAIHVSFTDFEASLSISSKLEERRMFWLLQGSGHFNYWRNGFVWWQSKHKNHRIARPRDKGRFSPLNWFEEIMDDKNRGFFCHSPLALMYISQRWFLMPINLSHFLDSIFIIYIVLTDSSFLKFLF